MFRLANLFFLSVLGLTLILGGLSAGVLRAADFWEAKPYSQWSAEETLKMLTDSPWCKTYFVKLPAIDPRSRQLEGTDAPAARGSTSRQHSNCCRTFEAGPAAQTSDAVQPGTESVAAGSTQVLPYRVFWLSSLRIRQALARFKQLQGESLSAQEEESLQRPVGDFVIAVSGAWMSPFNEATLEKLLPSTFLRSKKNRRKEMKLTAFISPRDRPDRFALFVFSRQDMTAQELTPQDGEIEFATGEDAFRIRASFKLEKVMKDGVPDF